MLRIILFGFEYNERYPNAEPVQKTLLINPELQPIDDDLEEDWEGCLSVPNLRGKVPRYKSIRYAGYDQKGNHIERFAYNFHARIVQHECDHIDGILFPQRINDFTSFGFIDELPAT